MRYTRLFFQRFKYLKSIRSDKIKTSFATVT